MLVNETDLLNAHRETLSRNALVRRINCHFAEEGDLRVLPYPKLDTGSDSVLVVPRSFLILEHADLETLGRVLGVLEPHERLVEEEEADERRN